MMPHHSNIVKALLRDSNGTQSIMQPHIVRPIGHEYNREYIMVDGMLFRRAGRLMDEIVYNQIDPNHIDVLPPCGTPYFSACPDEFYNVILRKGNAEVHRTKIMATNPLPGALTYAAKVYIFHRFNREEQAGEFQEVLALPIPMGPMPEYPPYDVGQAKNLDDAEQPSPLCPVCKKGLVDGLCVDAPHLLDLPEQIGV